MCTEVLWWSWCWQNILYHRKTQWRHHESQFKQLGKQSSSKSLRCASPGLQTQIQQRNHVQTLLRDRQTHKGPKWQPHYPEDDRIRLLWQYPWSQHRVHEDQKNTWSCGKTEKIAWIYKRPCVELVCTCPGVQSDSEIDWVCGPRLASYLVVKVNHGEHRDIGRGQVGQLSCAAPTRLWGGKRAQ